MITQEISPYSRSYGNYSGYGNHGYPPMVQRQVHQPPLQIGTVFPKPSPHSMTKLEFTMYLDQIGLKKGDLVASIYTAKPYTARHVYQVESIDELYRYVQWAPREIGPMCLNLRSCVSGSQLIKGGGNMYRKVLPEDIPEFWKLKLLQEE